MTARSMAGSGRAGVRAARSRFSIMVVVAVSTALLASCARGTATRAPAARDYAYEWSPRVVDQGRPVPKGGGVSKLGAPYMVKGRWYTPRHEPGYDQSGIASWYGADFHGRKTANGEIYDQGALTAAHPTLPLPSYAQVTNLANGRTLLVRINDRGPYAHDRIIDLSQAAARHLQFERQGTARVRVRYLGPAPLDGNDSAERRHLAQQPWIAGGPYASTLQPGWQQGYGLGYRR